MYQIIADEDQVQEPQLYARGDFDGDYTGFTEDEKFYYSDFGVPGGLYVDEKKIDDITAVKLVSVENAYFYLAEEADQNIYSLMMYKNGKREKLADDVMNFILTPDNDILYLHDYDTETHTGTLSLYNHGNPKIIDRGVTAIIN